MVALGLLAIACTHSSGAGAGAGAGSSTSSGLGGADAGHTCPQPVSLYYLSAVLPDGTHVSTASFGSNTPATSAKVTGPLHFAAPSGSTTSGAPSYESFQVEDATTHEVIQVEQEFSFAQLVEGATVTLYVGFVPDHQAPAVQIELADAAGELLYFGIAGSGAQPPGARVDVALGDKLCDGNVATGSIAFSFAPDDATVSIDDVSFGTVPMSDAVLRTVDGKSFLLTNKSSAQWTVLPAAAPPYVDYRQFAIVGRAAPP